MGKRGQRRPWQRDDDFDPDALLDELHGRASPPAASGARRRECRDKTPYDNRAAAAGAADDIEERTERSMDVYRCRFCGRWHVGSR